MTAGALASGAEVGAAAAAAAAEEVEKSLELTGAVDTSVEEAAAADVAVSATSPALALLESSSLASAVLVGEEAAAAAGEADVEATVSAAATSGTLMLTPYLLQRDWAKASVADEDYISKGVQRENVMIKKITLLIGRTAGLLDLRCEGRDEGYCATNALKICEAARCRA